MKQTKFKPNKVLTDKELEQKIITKYNKVNPQAHTLEEQVNLKLNKLNK